MLLLMSTLLAGQLSAGFPSHILVPVVSEPKIIEGLDFSVITQAQWQNPGSWSHGSQTITLQLRITNRMKHAMLFPTFDSYDLQLKSADGKDVKLSGGRDATFITPNILLQPGASFSLPLEVLLKVSYDDKDGSEPQELTLTVKDETGSATIASLKAGKYSISLKLSPTHYDFLKEAQLPAPLWAGKGSTDSVSFELK